MVGSENGRDTSAPRPASPVKRSILDMDQKTTSSDRLQSTVSDTDPIDTQQTTLANSKAASSIEAGSFANTSATSLEHSPTLSAREGDGIGGVSEIIPSLDEQVAEVKLLTQKVVEEGDRGVAISSKWLTRVLSRTTDGRDSSEFAKDAREGVIGQLDNGDIVPPGGFSEPILKDKNGAAYIPLSHGLRMGEEFEILPYEAFGKIVGWYGAVAGQKMIVRYAHDTAPPDATQTNVQYELYPPVITVQRVSMSKATTQDHDKSRSAAVNLRMRQARRSYGQMSPDDAVQVVSSRFEKYHKFLTRAKEYAGVPLTTKVKVWRNPPQLLNDDNAKVTPAKLVLDQADFDELESSSKIEAIEAQDSTADEKYNGRSNMETMMLLQSLTIILVEQTSGDPLPQRKTGSLGRAALKPQSTSTGRTSPAPGVMTRGRIARTGRTRGTVGLHNLGNTCYMNSALQCIRSVEELAVYFLMNSYKKEINASNPIGYKGAMATKYAEVVRGIYSESASGSYSPSGFKSTLAKHAPTFSGFGQQDSQEFLSFLVDALHEDLNRIEKKPFLENPDSDDNRVNDPAYIVELGETYRSNHRARNHSIAMDLFSGFYKNTMECPVCDKVSVTFDPYSSLTLQLPISNTVTHGFVYVPLYGQPVRHEVDLERTSTVLDLKQYIASKHDNVDPARLWMTEVYNHKIYKVFEDRKTMAEANIQSNDYIFIYELELVPTYPPAYKPSSHGRTRETSPDMSSEQADILTVPVFHRRIDSHTSSMTETMILHPQYISLTREEAKDLTLIRKKVLVAIAQLTSRPILMEEDVARSNDHEETAVISDHSEPSEDDYVNVTIDKSDAAADQISNSSVPGQVPAGFMDSEYPLSDRLRKMLFVLNYAKSAEGGHCASIASYEERSIREAKTRVKLPSRRSSIDSASSETTNGMIEDDTSNMGDDVTSIASVETPLSGQGDTTEEETDTIRSGRRNDNGKGNKFKSGKRAGKEQSLRKRREKNARKAKQLQEHTPKPPVNDAEDNQYYIQIGESLVLDWNTEAWADLFDGQKNLKHGEFLSSETGAGLPTIEDCSAIKKRAARERRKKHGISLEECFAETGKREKLSEDNAWYCNRCKTLRQASKTLDIWTLPDILVLHLKRFGGNRRFNDKIDVMVDYPIEGLDLNDKVGLKEDGKDYVYDLFAIDNHFGGLGGGHYTAFAKSFIDGAWYDYNDSSCTKQGDTPRKSAAAYLLFYRRRSDKPLGPEYLQDLVYKFRNSSETEESDTGEALLDGPSSILRGSSSNSLAAGATATTGKGLAASADGSGVGSNQKTSKSMTRIDGQVVYGPVKPAHLVKYSAEAPGWSFDGLDDDDNDDGMQLDGDNDSTKAEADGDRSSQDAEEDSGQNQPWNDTEIGFGLGDDDSAVHLEDAGAGDDGSVHDIVLPSEQK